MIILLSIKIDKNFKQLSNPFELRGNIPPFLIRLVSNTGFVHCKTGFWWALVLVATTHIAFHVRLRIHGIDELLLLKRRGWSTQALLMVHGEPNQSWDWWKIEYCLYGGILVDHWTPPKLKTLLRIRTLRDVWNWTLVYIIFRV